ncbi:hypothetical protein, partial [Aneurinibacillus migulanus]|uniref:hypothetical protein n=1 Tax=Aneurinibacillus migulanus TaxID=47500 RepID=UPI001C3F6C9B
GASLQPRCFSQCLLNGGLIIGLVGLFYKFFPTCSSTSIYSKKKQMSNEEKNGEIMRLNAMTFVFILFYYQ